MSTVEGKHEAAASRAAKHAHQAEQALSRARNIGLAADGKDRALAAANAHASLALYWMAKPMVEQAALAGLAYPKSVYTAEETAQAHHERTAETARTSAFVPARLSDPYDDMHSQAQRNAARAATTGSTTKPQ